MKNQEQTPLLDVLLARAKRGVTSFHTPGIKMARELIRLRSFTGKNVYKLDVTVFPEVDSLHDPVGPIKKAQALMAQAYGVKYSQFLVNGSSVGNMAMLMSACHPGDSVILSRNAHKSTLSGMIMSGIWPIWIQPKIDQHLDIIFDSDAAQMEAGAAPISGSQSRFCHQPDLQRRHDRFKKIARLCHARGKMLLVDEAHGAHLKFHKDLPVSAVEAGADMCVQSTHKILSALSQGLGAACEFGHGGYYARAQNFVAAADDQPELFHLGFAGRGTPPGVFSGEKFFAVDPIGRGTRASASTICSTLLF